MLAGGRGWGADAVEAAVATSGLGDRVVRTGYVDDAAIPALLRSATAAVYPSLYEGFGLPALEALACGTTLVTTSGTAMEEVAGASALLVPPGDGGALADVLDTVLTGRGDDRAASERRSLGFDVVERHTWGASADLHVAAYRTAAGAVKPDGPRHGPRTRRSPGSRPASRVTRRALPDHRRPRLRGHVAGRSSPQLR